MEYSGWTLYDEVTLVIKRDEHNTYKKYDYPQAYIVDPKNKKQLQSAINWGEFKKSTYNKEKKCYDYETIAPEIITIKNEGFRIQLLDCAGESYQGGKLSFWNCLISNNEHGIEVVVGIAANLLLTLLMQNEFRYGYCEKTVCFARMAGGVGVLTKDMKEYQDAIRDMQTKKDISKKKTSKWQIGKNYITLTIDETYLGELYRPLKLDYERVNTGRYWDYQRELVLSIDEHPEKQLIAYTNQFEDKNIRSLSELKNVWLHTLDENYRGLIEKSKESKVSNLDTYKLFSNIPLFEFNYLGDKKKLPSRQQGEYNIDIDIDLKIFYKEIIEYAQDLAIKLFEHTDKIHPMYLDKLIVRTEKFEISDLTEREQKILDLIKTSKKEQVKVKI